MLKVGETIRCRDVDDLIETTKELQRARISTDFLYEKDGEIGLWLIVVEEEE